jgi:threonine/homoserine/homoserine lactone efflux protein
MSWQVWSLFVVTETVLCLTPGPAVLLVLSTALGRGTAQSLWSALGILAANALYFVLSATSLGAVLVASYDLFFAIKWVGAAYLVYLGVKTFLGKGAGLSISGAGAGQPKVPGRRLLLNGFVLQAANPKSILFFTALLPQFIDPKGEVAWQVGILGVTSIVIELVVLAGYGALAGRAARLAAQPRFATITDRLAGGLLITAGVGLAALRRGG